MYHRGDIPAAGGGLFHSETGPALGIAGTCGEIQNRWPAADIVIGRNFSRSASDNIGNDLLDVRRLYGRCRQFHRADVFLRCGPRDADHIFVKRFLSLPADLRACRYQECVPDGAEAGKGVRAKALTVICAVTIAAALVIFALTSIIPHAPAGVTRIGCAIYAVLISSMLAMSALQRQWTFAAGAALFLLSDMILSWNKFVSPVSYSNILIMTTYYAGQLLIWLTAARVCSERR